MNSFIKSILEDKDLREVLFNFKQMYKESEFENEISKFFKVEDKEKKFISKYTQWLYIDKNNYLYGTLNKFVIKYDIKENKFYFICEGFRNLPFILMEKNELFPKVWENYQKLCKKYDLQLKENSDIKSFEKYLKDFV